MKNNEEKFSIVFHIWLLYIIYIPTIIIKRLQFGIHFQTYCTLYKVAHFKLYAQHSG